MINNTLNSVIPVHHKTKYTYISYFLIYNFVIQSLVASIWRQSDNQLNVRKAFHFGISHSFKYFDVMWELQ